MKLIVATVLAALIAAASSAGAMADNYGGVTAAEKQRVTKEVYRYWTGWEARKMLCIIGRESGFNKMARSRTNDHGLAQANIIWARPMGKTWEKRYTIKGGIEIAYRIYRAQGWQAWAATVHRC